MSLIKIKIYLLFFCVACFQLLSAQERKSFYVADYKVPCPGNAQQECYLVKEKNKQDWRTLSNYIEGFNYSEGYTYKIKVSITRYNQVAQGVSSVTYQLLKVNSKKKTNFSPVEKLNGKWSLQFIYQDTTFIKLIDSTSVVVEVNTATGKLSGKNICNNFFGPFKINGNQIEIGALGATRMMCDGINLEDIIFKMLREMKSYSVKANRLIMYNENKVDRLEFVKY